MPRYYIETWGCQMNVHDSQKLAGELEHRGYARTERRDEADVILLNTCSIREKAEEKLFSELGRLRELKQANPGLIIGVCGCVAQQEGKGIFARAPYVDFVLGPRATGSLPVLLESARCGSASRLVDIAYRTDSIDFPGERIRRDDRGKAYVTIIEGCNHRCTYCVVPTTRGREICRRLEDVLAEVRGLAARGVIEIEFLGQTVNAYRDAAGHGLGDLLRETCTVAGIERIRFTTSHPAQMTESLMDAMALARPKLGAYLHLPVQSGSDDVLRAMRRGYGRDGYLQKIALLRQRIPEMLFGTDVIVGFPGESEADFDQTLELLEQVPFDTVYAFAYSQRPGTTALALGDTVPAELKRERLERVFGLQKRIQQQRNQLWHGRRIQVLVEGPSRRDRGRWTGRSPENRVVNFTGTVTPGRLAWVEIEGSTAFALAGRSVAETFA